MLDLSHLFILPIGKAAHVKTDGKPSSPPPGSVACMQLLYNACKV